MDLTYDTVPARQSVTGRDLRRCQDAIVGDVIKRADGSGAATSHQSHEAREGVGGPRSCSTGVIHARFAESGEGWACVGSRTIFVIDRMHPINTDQKHMVATKVFIGTAPLLRAGDRSKRDGRSKKKHPFFVLRESFYLSEVVSAHTLPAVDMGPGKVVWDASVSIL